MSARERSARRVRSIPASLTLTRYFRLLRCKQPGKALHWRDKRCRDQQRTSWRNMPPSSEDNNGAGNYDAEAQAQNREALPLAGSCQVQQKWQLHQCRAGNREADGGPDQAPADGCRWLREKERSKPEPNHRISKEERRTDQYVPPIALVARNPQNHSVPRRCVKCKRKERDSACHQPNQ